MRIAHISDIHCNNGSDFNPKMFDKATEQLNKYEADFIFITGDLTSMGLLSEYEMAEKRLTEINGEKIIVPGNHDERNLGFKLFPEFFGKTDFIKIKGFHRCFSLLLLLLLPFYVLQDTITPQPQSGF